MDGILLINKEVGLTSQAVLTKLKRILGEKRIGHCGTLDPIASGVLVVLIGAATKLSSYLLEKDKEYLAKVKLGVKTDTYDVTGNVIKEGKVENITNESIDEALASFLGDIKQTPPIYSAIKVDGKKLYEYARIGREVEIKPKDVTIYEIKRTSELENDEFSFLVKASKGTYIRSLINDLGEKLGTFATMSSLTRIKSGKFDISDSKKIEDIEKGNFKLIEMADAIDLEKVIVSDKLIKTILNGGKISLKEFSIKEKEVALIYEGKLVAIYEKDLNYYKPVRVWN